jgi:hypothetical protein
VPTCASDQRISFCLASFSVMLYAVLFQI